MLEFRNTQGKPIPALKPSLEAKLLPGKLRQTFRLSNGLDVRMELIFLSSRDTGVRVTLSNPTKEDLHLQPLLTGDVLLKGTRVVRRDKGLVVVVPHKVADNKTAMAVVLTDPQSSGQLRFDRCPSCVEESWGQRRGKKHNDIGMFRLLCGARVVPAGKEVLMSFTQSFYFNSDEESAGSAIARAFLSDHGYQALQDNTERWEERYLSPILTHPDMSGQERWLAVKALVTLTTNWRGPHGAFQHSAIFGDHTMTFWAWAWDSWKTAAYVNRPVLRLSLRHIVQSCEAQLC